MRARKRGGGRQRTGRSEGCFLQENNARQSPQQTPSTKASCSIHWWLRLLAGPTGSRSARFRFQPSRHRVGSLRAFSTLAAETLLVTLHFLPYHRPARPLSPRYLRALPHPVSSDLSYSGPHALCSVGMGSRTMLRRVRRDRRRPLTRENERERESESTPQARTLASSLNSMQNQSGRTVYSAQACGRAASEIDTSIESAPSTNTLPQTIDNPREYSSTSKSLERAFSKPFPGTEHTQKSLPDI